MKKIKILEGFPSIECCVIFDHFPSDQLCVLCESGDDSPCVLVPLDGVGDGRILEARPVHVDCLLDGMRINVGLGIVYKNFSWK